MISKALATVVVMASFSGAAYCADLTVHVAPGVHFSQLQKIYGPNTPVSGFLQVTAGGLSLSSDFFDSLLSSLTSARISQMNPITNLESLKPYLPGQSIPFTFEVMNGDTSQVYYHCTVTQPISSIPKNAHYQFVVTSLNNQCKLLVN